MQPSSDIPNPETIQSPIQSKYNTLLSEFQYLTERIQSFQGWMCKCFAIKKNPRVIDLQFEAVEEYIANKFNIEIERMSNECKITIQKANDQKSKLETKLNVAKQKNDKISEQKKALAVQKQKLNKKIEQMKVDIEDKNKRLQSGRKKISTLEQDLSAAMTQTKKMQTKFHESQESVKNLRQKLKNKEQEMQALQNAYLSKIKEINQQLGLSKSRQDELQFNAKEQEQNIKKLQIDNKRKIDEIVTSNQKKVRQTISGYEKQFQKKKRQYDSLYNTAAIRYEKAMKNAIEKNEHAMKKQGEEYETKLAEESERYKQLRDAKWTSENALESRVRALQFEQQKINGIIKNNNNRISQLQKQLLEKTNLYNETSKQLESSTLTLQSQTQTFLKQKTNYQNQIFRILEQKEKEMKAQDKIFKQTVKVIEFDSQEKINTSKIKAHEEAQIAKNTLRNSIMDMQIKHKKEVVKLSEDFKKIKQQYQGVHNVYENKFKASEKTFRQHTSAINKRTQYEKEVVIQKMERDKSQMKTQYETIIHKYEKEFKTKVEEEKLLVIMEKDDIIDKQKQFYEQEIKSLARSIEIAGNQKVMGVERKVKFVEKKLRDLEVQYQLIIKEKEMLSKTSNTQMDSMKELQGMFKEEIQKMQQRYSEGEIKHDSQRYQLEGEITRLTNELEQNKKEYQKKEQLVLASCKNRITKNEVEMKEFGSKMKQQFEDLEASCNERYNVLAKSYKELQFLSSQKTSLPQDIEIMKVLHKGVLEKEQDLKKQRQTLVELRKELLGKEQANRIFNMKKLDSLNKMSVNPPNTLYKL